MVQNAWLQLVSGNAIIRVILRLKNVKAVLKAWNVLVVGNMQQEIMQAQQQVDVVQFKIYSQGFLDSLFHKEVEAHAHLDHISRK